MEKRKYTNEEMCQMMVKHAEKMEEDYDRDKDKINKGFEDDPNNMANWFSAVQKAGVPYPKTTMVPMSHEAREDLYNAFDCKPIGELGLNFAAEMELAANKIGYPVFIRNGIMSGKHSWKNSCFVESMSSNMISHVLSILETNMMAMGASFPTCYAVREIIPTTPIFHAFHGNMPITKERRYFMNDGKVICHHPYWPIEAFEDKHTFKSIDNWREPLAVMNEENSAEIWKLTKLSETVGKYFKGYWSIDWLQRNDSSWFCIDMAEGWSSYHWKDCEHDLRRKK